jgi:CRISPR-associated protein Cas1
LELASRGIQLFILDFRGQIVSSLSGNHQHAVTEVRKKQFLFIQSDKSIHLSSYILYGKVRNQRAVLKYFQKYFNKTNLDYSRILEDSEKSILRASLQMIKVSREIRPDIRSELMGYEGSCASLYWKALRETNLLPNSFSARTGKDSSEITNQCLNYGYAILTTYVWNCIINAGMEPYAGILHVDRPGKPSLVLDLMEEYRPWCVDRIIIKLRNQIETEKVINPKIKKEIISEVHKTFLHRYLYKGKELKLESILQRQIYRISAHFFGKKKYKPFLFKW